MAIIRNLAAAAETAGVAFGLKLTNTLETANEKQNLPRSEGMVYMSGRSLHPISKMCIRDSIPGHNAPGGGATNLVILNYDSPTPLTQDNFPGHFCYAFDARNVESVISQGRLIVDHGRLAGMDEADILAYANEQARRLWALL